MMASTFYVAKDENDLNESLLKMLTCSSCTQYLSSPIYQCRRGHNFCSGCISTCTKCPTCKVDFIKSRNTSLEMISRSFLYPCKNRTSGCTQKFKLKDLYQHEDICQHEQIYECVLGKHDQSCSWIGPRSKILSHVKHSHPTKIFFVENIECVIRNYDAADNFSSAFLIRALDEIFWYYNKQDTNTGRFLGAVQYIGSKQRALKFKYEVDFYSKCESDFKVSFSRITHCDDEEVDDIYNSEQCMSFSSNMVKNFLRKDNSLHFNLKVIPI